MRKVIFQYWIFPIREADENNRNGKTKEGTGCFSEPQSGYFHGWGYECHEDANSVAMESVALVEHCTTGYMHNVQPEKMRFVTPPETKDNWYKEFKKDSHVNDVVPYITPSKLSAELETGEWVIDKADFKESLCCIAGKIDSLAPRTERIQNISEALKKMITKL